MTTRTWSPGEVVAGRWKVHELTTTVSQVGTSCTLWKCRVDGEVRTGFWVWRRVQKINKEILVRVLAFSPGAGIIHYQAAREVLDGVVGGRYMNYPTAAPLVRRTQGEVR